jgi:hypothetical protein
MSAALKLLWKLRPFQAQKRGNQTTRACKYFNLNIDHGLLRWSKS